MTIEPARIWWTVDQLAEAGLPDVPRTRQGVQAKAEAEGWRAQAGFARRREGRGGGWEYHWTLLPLRARTKLLAAAAVPAPEKPVDRDAQWAWFEGLPDSVKDKARVRLAILQQVEALEVALGRHLAVASVARSSKVGARTIWTWLAMVEGIAAADRLAWLAPRNRAEGVARSQPKACDPAFFDALRADFLRLAAPPFADCYRRAVKLAKAEGWDILPERTMRRMMDREVSTPVQVLARKGIEALKRMYPAQVRDKSAMRALEAVNGDFHKFDVFCRWPDGTVGRPQMVAFQDIYSGRILSWRVDVSANSTAVLLAAGDMIEQWGIPEHVLLDNGREFAAKAVTGGAATRFRFKVRDDDIPGLFTMLGCTIHWATPYAGQSKPIERAFRDMASSIAKDPRFAGAWTGNRPDAKPEDYGSRAIPLEDFLRVLGEGIEEHNTREGRRSEVAFGRSFAEVFDESYASAPIRKATEAQRRLWLMGAEGVRCATKNGQITFLDSDFWEPWLIDHAGERVVIRFDPADVQAGVHVYAQGGAYLGHAACLKAGAFFDLEDARAHARARNAWMAAEKRAAEAHRKMTAAELGRALDKVPSAAPVAPEAKVVKAVFGKGVKAAKPAPQGEAAAVVALPVAAPVAPIDDTVEGLFRRAVDLAQRIERGEAVTEAQRAWLTAYEASAEYRAALTMYQAGMITTGQG